MATMRLAAVIKRVELNEADQEVPQLKQSYDNEGRMIQNQAVDHCGRCRYANSGSGDASR